LPSLLIGITSLSARIAINRDDGYHPKQKARRRREFHKFLGSRSITDAPDGPAILNELRFNLGAICTRPVPFEAACAIGGLQPVSPSCSNPVESPRGNLRIGMSGAVAAGTALAQRSSINRVSHAGARNARALLSP